MSVTDTVLHSKRSHAPTNATVPTATPDLPTWSSPHFPGLARVDPVSDLSSKEDRLLSPTALAVSTVNKATSFGAFKFGQYRSYWRMKTDQSLAAWAN